MNFITKELNLKKMKTIKSFLFVMLMLVASSVMADPVSGESSEPVNAEVAEKEVLVIYLSNFYETPGHKEAVAQVVQPGGGLPSGNYTYEWTIIPGGATTSANMWYTNARRGDVSVNFNTQISSRVELECKVYLNGSLYDTLSYFWYLY